MSLESRRMKFAGYKQTYLLRNVSVRNVITAKRRNPMKNLHNLPNLSLLDRFMGNKRVRVNVITNAKWHERLRGGNQRDLMKSRAIKSVLVERNGIKLDWVRLNYVTHVLGGSMDCVLGPNDSDQATARGRL